MEPPREIQLDYAIIGVNYPNFAITEEVKQQIEAEILSGSVEIQIVVSALQRGIWRVQFQNENSRDQFLEGAMQLPQFDAFTVLPFRDVPLIRYQARFPGMNLTNHQILSRINKDNEGIDTSCWVLHRIDQDDNTMEIEVDAESFLFIEERNRILLFKSNFVNFLRIIN